MILVPVESVTAMTSPFSFDFQIDINTNNSTTNDNFNATNSNNNSNDTEGTTVSTTTLTTATSVSERQMQSDAIRSNNNNNNNRNRDRDRRKIPFAWMDTDYIKALLLERAQEEIIYTDIAVTTTTTVQEVLSQSSQPTSTIAPRSTTTDPVVCMTKNNTNTTNASSMHCVDLSQSSYRKPSIVNDIVEEEEEESNIILPGIYEGGNTVWECSCDLVQYLWEHNITLHGSQQQPHHHHHASACSDHDHLVAVEAIIDNNETQQHHQQQQSTTSNSRPLYALELGCGHGLPGCYLLQNALSLVSTVRPNTEQDDSNNNNNNHDHHNTMQQQVGIVPCDDRNALPLPLHTMNAFTIVFTDYNESVILDATISNIVLNCHHSTPASTSGCNTDDINNNINDSMEHVVNRNSDDSTTTATTAIAADHIVLGSGDWMDMSRQIHQQQQQQRSEGGMGGITIDDQYHTITTTADVRDIEENSTHVNSNNSSVHHRLPPDGYYDMILGAETIYTPLAAQETAMLLQRHLRPQTGVAYIATKRYYFGVGGGVDVFREYCTQQQRNNSTIQLLVETVKVIDNGAGNIREVLRVQSRCV